ncbi:unnamed protein product [Calypogeia fissa]
MMACDPSPQQGGPENVNSDEYSHRGSNQKWSRDSPSLLRVVKLSPELRIFSGFRWAGLEWEGKVLGHCGIEPFEE